MKYLYIYNSFIGKIHILSDGNFITNVLFPQNNSFDLACNNYQENNNLPAFQKATLWLDQYFKGNNPNFTLPIDPEGTPFQKEVWKLLCDIPYGQLTTYKDIAVKIASYFGKDKMAARAIGRAVGCNPLPIFIPCHRVIGSNGNLTGFSAGIDLKIELLKLEGHNINNFSLPAKNTHEKNKY